MSEFERDAPEKLGQSQVCGELHGQLLRGKGPGPRQEGDPPRGQKGQATASSPRVSRWGTALDTLISFQQKLCKTCGPAELQGKTFVLVLGLKSALLTVTV